MSTRENLHATGPNGEACIVVRTFSEIDTSNQSGRSSVRGLPSYRLATGDRLNPTGDEKVFETLDKKRQYRIR